mgnify:CR=1 FL=1
MADPRIQTLASIDHFSSVFAYPTPLSVSKNDINLRRYYFSFEPIPHKVIFYLPSLPVKSKAAFGQFDAQITKGCQRPY